MIQILKDKVIAGEHLTKNDVKILLSTDLHLLCEAADEIRKHFCGNAFDLCSIINGKSGNCSEDCKFCAQSSHNNAKIITYPLLSTAALVEGAKENARQGILRFSIVTAGRSLHGYEMEQVCESYQEIQKQCDISLCASMGLLTKAQFLKLKKAGVTRYHNNLETSERFFKHVCSTHTYEDKVLAIKNAQDAGLSVCSGGIIGMGETMEDRIDMALTLRALHIRSIPLNILNPIPGTEFAHNTVLSQEEIARTIAIFRFLIPDSIIRLAGGRNLLPDFGFGLFRAGANGAITQDMLTTAGNTIQNDKNIIQSLGFEVKCFE